MKKLFLILIALACLPAFAAGQVVEEIIARVNNQIITRSEFERSKDQLKDEVKQQDPNDPDKVYAEREKDVLRDLIDQQLLLDKGKDLGITGDTDLIKRLDQMRKDMKLESLEDLEKEADQAGHLLGRLQAEHAQPDHHPEGDRRGSRRPPLHHKDEEQKFYDEHKSEMEQPEYIRLSEILVAPKTSLRLPTPAAARMPTPAHPAADRSCRPCRLDEPPIRPPTPPLSAPPRPRPTICSSRFTTAPLSKTSPRNILTVLLPPMAALWASSSAASWPRNSKTKPSP